MEGGGGGFGGLTRSNILDPEAQEFHPSMIQTPPPHPQIYVPYPSLPFFDPGFPVVPPPPQAPMAVAAGLPDGAPTRSLVLSQVPVGATEAIVRAEMEAFGGVRAVEMGRAAEGIVTVHFFDQRDAQAALAEIREQHVRQQSRIGQQYCLMMSNWAVPPPPPPPQPPMGMIVSPFRGMIMGRAVWAQFAPPMSGPNLGSLAVFNLDPSVSSPAFRAMFEVFGDVKELRETKKQQQRFIEFYDIRDAARALGDLNGKEINGRRVVVEFSRPAGHLSPSAAAVSRRPFLSPPSSKPTTTIATTSRPTTQTQNPPRRLTQPSDASPSTVRGPSSSLPSPLPPQTQKELKKNAKKQQQQQQSSSSSSNTGKKKSQGSKRASDSRFQFISEGGEGSSEDQTTNCRRDSRTTVMIKNIPNKYSQKLLLNMLDNHCIHCNEKISDSTDGDDDQQQQQQQQQQQPFSSYDFVYLPIDFKIGFCYLFMSFQNRIKSCIKMRRGFDCLTETVVVGDGRCSNKCNVGYGFVNMTSPEATWRLYKAFHRQPWEVFNSRKICEVTYARLQGLEALKEHFKNSKFACDTDEYLPVVFDPPRDGKNLTDPVPIVGGPTGSSTPSDVCEGGGDDDDDDTEGDGRDRDVES
ncbi:hypothetical protein QJS10_CPB04g01630 [Acorus calamus]|uniref:RRM domain-containing protein n=1 Tax=Acorus calamus TaxID=4465 RepID=A0AAV9EZ50_ACOCL|nr:hypothetical protein QJS10_CPB04g01630 [Acorus calamus]